MKMMKNKYQMDMCRGPLFRQIVVFSVPLMLSGILQLLFNAADLIVIGRFASHEALAAVGATSALTMLIVNVFMGLSLGANVLVSNYYGAKDRKNMSRTVHTAVLLSTAGGVFLALIGILLAEPLLILMATPENILPKSRLYMWIYFAGMPFIMLYNFVEVGDGGIILGISHLPLSTQGKNYLEGLQAVEYTHMENSNLGYPQCVSINTLYFDQDTPSNSYNSADANVTLAHELGHYLGLHHAFNESSEDINADSDYCLDTPPYNRSLYEQSVMIPAYQAWQASNFDMTALQPGFLRTNSLNPEQTFTSYNLMDYEISHSDRFTLNQRERMRHVLEYSPLIPGPKRTASTRSVAPQGVLDIPIIYKVCYMH